MRLYQTPTISWTPPAKKIDTRAAFSSTAPMPQAIRKIANTSNQVITSINTNKITDNNYKTKQNFLTPNKESLDLIQPDRRITNQKIILSHYNKTEKLPDFTKAKRPICTIIPPVSVTKTVTSSKEPHNSVHPKAYIYSPFCNRDMIAQAMAINAPRVLQGKAPYPILFAGSMEPIKRSFNIFQENETKHRLASAENLYRQFKPYLNKENIETLHQSCPRKTKLIGEYLALEQMIFVPLAQAKTAQLEKIYVLGHSTAKSPNIGQSSHLLDKSKSVKEIATELKDVIAQTNCTIDIRLLACHSADRETATSFNEKTLEDNTKSLGRAKPLAQHMIEAMAQQGTENVRVFGYHGLGIRGGDSYYHKARVLEGDFNAHRAGRARASDYRTEFFVGSPPVRIHAS